MFTFILMIDCRSCFQSTSPLPISSESVPNPLVISPDLIADFRALPFADNTFPVVFDPPHLERVGDNAWMGKKYGRFNKDTWRDDLRAGFAEAFRVLWTHGVLIFKWNETQIPVSQTKPTG